MSTQMADNTRAEPATRIVDGIEIPTTGTWRVDPGHSEIGFVGRHFGLTRIRGRFTGVHGTVTVGSAPDDSHVEVTIEMASVSSGDQSRDDHLRSADFFDVERHPTATFRSTGITAGGTHGTMLGELTITGIARPVMLEFTYLGHAADPWGNDRAVFSAAGTIDRHDWGLTWNMVLEAGGLLVSKEIRLEMEVELIREAG